MPLLKLWAGSLVMLAAVSLPLQAASPVKVGSKIDTEGALLGNIILQVLESHGVPTVNKVQLGTTPVVRGAITSGELDIYPEYTGNGAFFFKDENGNDVFISDAETRYLSSEVAGGFTGTIIGLFAINEKGDGVSRYEKLSVKHEA